MWSHFDGGSCPGSAVGVKTRLDNGVSGFIHTKNISDKMVRNPEERVKVSDGISLLSLCLSIFLWLGFIALSVFLWLDFIALSFCGWVSLLCLSFCGWILLLSLSVFLPQDFIALSLCLSATGFHCSFCSRISLFSLSFCGWISLFSVFLWQDFIVLCLSVAGFNCSLCLSVAGFHWSVCLFVVGHPSVHLPLSPFCCFCNDEEGPVSQQRNLGRPLTPVMNMDLLCCGLSGLECVSLLHIVSCCCCCRCPAAWDDHPCSYHQDRH